MASVGREVIMIMRVEDEEGVKGREGGGKVLVIGEGEDTLLCLTSPLSHLYLFSSFPSIPFPLPTTSLLPFSHVVLREDLTLFVHSKEACVQ